MIHSKLERGLAGLQAGMLGGIAMLVVMVAISVLDRRNWWSYPNIVAGCFYGARSIGAGLGWHTVSGMALQLVIAGVAGALFGSLFGGVTGSRRGLAFGLVWGALVFFMSGQFYRVFKPVVFAYLPASEALVAHLVYGVSLPWMGRLAGAGHDGEFGREVASLASGNLALGAGPGPPAARPDGTPIVPGAMPSGGASRSAEDNGDARDGRR